MNSGETICVGDQFGRGVVLDPDVGRQNRHILVRLRCAPEVGGCGAVYETTAVHLRGGHTRSCGCLNREITGRVNGQRLTTHGLTDHPLYDTWADMLRRCENPADRAYPDYGGRGITVWGPWHDLARFIRDVEAEIGPRPPGRTPGGMPLRTLNRINNDRGYEPGNVEWADWSTQRVNSRPRSGS